ncbi:MAG: ABC transporter permease [Spirochaetia bacterium]|jgi:lipoprotein-releasing system permease protein
MRSALPLLFASRYFRTQRRDSGNASTLLSVVGIAVGVMTLTVVLAVMNGFQLGFIDNIVEISSYHLQVRPRLDAAPVGQVPVLDASAVERLRDIRGVIAIVPFVKRQALIESVFQRPRACSVMAVSPDLFAEDPVQARILAPLDGAFALGDPAAIVVGSELALALGIRIGDSLSLASYATGAHGRPVPRRDMFHVTGTFHTGYLDFDSTLAFISLPAADALYGGGSPLPRTWGIKLANRFDDARPLREASALLRETGFTVESWRTYNRSFFDALFVEKLMMMVLVGLIFLVVGFNVYHSLRRSVFERMEEIAVLKAVGVPPVRIQAIFVLEGLFIGVIGGASGLIAGLALSVNVNEVFRIVELAVNWALMLGRMLAFSFTTGAEQARFAIFSPADFYLTQVPSHVYLREAFLVAFFAVVACAGAAGAASRAISRFRPAEVLRYE